MRLNFLLIFTLFLVGVYGNVNTANSQESFPLERLQVLCDAVKEGGRQPTDADLKRVQMQIFTATEKLRSRLPRSDWNTLPLENLRQVLRRTGSPSEAISETYQILAGPNELDSEITGPFTRLLRKYLTLEIAVSNENFSEEYRAFCEGIPQFVELFLSEDHPEYGSALTDAMAWLSDIGDCAPHAGPIASLLEEVFGRPNLFVQVSSDFLAHPFQRTIEEPLVVNDRVLDTYVRGTGQVNGQTSIEFLPNDNRAQIRLQLETQMSTDTLGRNGPVRVSSTNSGSVWSEKMIFLSEDRFHTTAARSSSDLKSLTTGIGVEAGCLMQGVLMKVAKNKVPKRKPLYDAESRRLAASRLSGRLNTEVDSQIAQLSARYQEELREPLLKTDLFETPWKFQTTETELLWSAAVAASSQPAAASTPPGLPDFCDVAVHLHQSALNNAAQSLLAGRRIEIDEFVTQLQEKYPRLAERFERDEENPLTAITFAEKSPIVCTFKENLATIAIHIDQFEQDEQEYPGLDITIKYRVKAEPVMENGTSTMSFVFEKAEPPTVFPPGFDPNSGARITGRNLAIRNIVMKRLDGQLEDTFVVSPLELEEQWKGKGLLTPQTITASQGWLVLSWLFQ